MENLWISNHLTAERPAPEHGFALRCHLAQMLEAGVDIMHVDAAAVLQQAVRFDRRDELQNLLAAAPDALRRSRLGFVAQSPEILSDLLAMGLEPDETDAFGATRLFSAPSDLARVLIDHGADIHHRDIDGRTPLHSSPAAELLVDAGADLGASDELGRTPLHTNPVAVASIWAATARATSPRSAAGQTPMERAVAVGSSRDVAALERIGVPRTGALEVGSVARRGVVHRAMQHAAMFSSEGSVVHWFVLIEGFLATDAGDLPFRLWNDHGLVRPSSSTIDWLSTLRQACAPMSRSDGLRNLELVWYEHEHVDAQIERSSVTASGRNAAMLDLRVRHGDTVDDVRTRIDFRGIQLHGEVDGQARAASKPLADAAFEAIPRFAEHFAVERSEFTRGFSAVPR